jgi:thymidylate synthase (FAD)
LKVELVRYTVEPLEAMANSARTCYASESGNDEAIVKFCIESGHESISEFGDFHFLVSGVSRIITQQITRHRIASFAQRSQRYVNENNFEYVIPPSIENDTQALMRFKLLMDSIKNTYKSLVDSGIPKEDARFALPNAIESVINIKMNFRELMHFCGVRLCSRAQWEIQLIAREMKKLVGGVSPFLSTFLVPKCMKIGYCNELKDSCGLRPSEAEVLALYEWWRSFGKPSIDELATAYEHWIDER